MSRTVDHPKPQPKPPTNSPPPAKPKESMRDLVEQVVVAIILAMLVRGFDAEAFVIPTGSMAPTLMGRHKEIRCPQCRYEYAINASEDSETMIRRDRLEEVGICPNCRFLTSVADTPSFKGDRILVSKFPYELPNLPGSSAPRRWDVVVFHYPVTPETNYIKRMVGLPGEDLRVDRGDIYTRPTGSGDAFRIERKPLYHQKAMQMLVHDDAYRPAKFKDHPEWDRWRGSDGWKEEAPGRYVVAAPAGSEWSRLGYHHLVADPEQWAAIDAGTALPRPPRPTLITDFYGYNTNVSFTPYDNWLQSNWVGDLTLSARVEVRKPTGRVRFELVEAGVAYRCDIDLATGQATLLRGDETLGQAATPLSGTGSHAVVFANVDDRLTLWVDGATPFGDGVEYTSAADAARGPNAADLQPATIAARDGADLLASDLVLKRDIYYTQNPGYPDYAIRAGSSDADAGPVLSMFNFLADPAQFAVLGEMTPREPFTIRPDHFMMMGDNSPRSYDSRAWDAKDQAWRTVERLRWEVPRSMLIGKAFFVYWPHGKPFGPDIRLSRDFRIPFRPYVERMKWIH